jgi:lambda repressor-like predicted transcriptional regulator
VKPGYRRIKSDEIRARIHMQSLKMWWVAEAAGIHKTTLRRWLSRQILGVSPARVERLAAVLGAPLHEIVED